MQDAKYAIVEEVCVPRVNGTMEVSATGYTFLEFIIIYFLLDLLLDTKVVGNQLIPFEKINLVVMFYGFF